MSASQIFAGLALIVGLAVACQILAASLRIPAIILLLPAGFAASRPKCGHPGRVMTMTSALSRMDRGSGPAPVCCRRPWRGEGSAPARSAW